MPSRVSLVNLQKFTLNAWLELPSMKMLAPAQKMRGLRLVRTTACTSGCSKRRRCKRVGELDVDAQVVGVQLELVVVRPQAGVFAHVHRERGDVAVEGQLPVLVLSGGGFESDRGRSDSLFHSAKFTTI